MFRKKLNEGDLVLIKKTMETGKITAIHYNPYTQWTSVSSYQVNGSCYSRNQLKKL